MKTTRSAWLLVLVLACGKAPLSPAGTGGASAGGAGGTLIASDGGGTPGTGGTAAQTGTGGIASLGGAGATGTGGVAATGGTAGSALDGGPWLGGWDAQAGGKGGSSTPFALGGSGGTSVPGSTGAAKLVLSTTTLNLGTLDVGATGIGTVTVTNVGTGTSGTLLVTPGAGMTATGCSGRLAPSSDCILTIAATPTFTGSFTGTVQIAADPGATTPLLVSVIASISTGVIFTVTPGAIDFGNVTVGVAVRCPTITITAGIAIADLTITSTGPDVSIDKIATTCTGVLATGASCAVAANFMASTSGPKSDVILISAGGTAGKMVKIPVTAVAATPAKLVISPSAALFAAYVGTASPAITFAVANVGDVATGSVVATVTGPAAADFSVASTTCSLLSPLQACTVSVVFQPGDSDAGATREATLVVTDTGPAASQVSAPLRGTPYAPVTFSIAMTSPDLGAVPVGTVGRAAMVTVGNLSDHVSGTLAITVSSPEFPIAGDTCTGTRLAQTAACTFAVALKPATAGAKSAVITVTDTWGATATQAISGTGTP